MDASRELPSVLVVGCGGIGGIVAASLADIGVPVTAVTGNAAVAEALRTRGARIREDGTERTVGAIEAHERWPGDDRRYDFVLLATQPPRVEDAARETVGALAENGRMVCFQNGLTEPRVAKIAGADRVIGGIVAWGGSQLEPGVYDRTSAGGFVLGRLDGAIDEPIQRLARALECIGPVTTTENLIGARWSKLAINCTITTLGALGGDRLGALMRSRRVRRLGLEIMTETVEVARAERVRLEKVSGTLDLDWIALTPAERAAAGGPTVMTKHGLLLAVGARFRRLRSSMLAAIERGKTPAVDFLNGEVVTHAAKHGIDVPVNRTAQEWVHRVARRELTPSMDLIYRLYAETSAVRG